MEIKIEVSKTFVLEKAVCNHGFFMMAPNRWNPSSKTLVRPLRLLNLHSVTVSISQPAPTSLSITVINDDALITPSDHKPIIDQVRRMLRLSKEDEEKVQGFHKLHTEAAKKGFGRLFRNPSLFEDIVKSFLLCGCPFKKSLDMAENLCRVNRKRKRGRRKESCPKPQGNFPSAQELLSFGQRKFAECDLGYRFTPILVLADDVTNGRINLDDFENVGNADKLYNILIGMKGIGDFVACNVFMCMGFYHRVPVDSETVRHIKQVHQRQDCDIRKTGNKIVKQIYGKYEPFQTLAYWLELVEYYENKLGKLSLMQACDYKYAAGSLLDHYSPNY